MERRKDGPKTSGHIRDDDEKLEFDIESGKSEVKIFSTFESMGLKKMNC